MFFVQLSLPLLLPLLRNLTPTINLLFDEPLYPRQSSVSPPRPPPPPPPPILPVHRRHRQRWRLPESLDRWKSTRTLSSTPASIPPRISTILRPNRSKMVRRPRR